MKIPRTHGPAIAALILIGLVHTDCTGKSQGKPETGKKGSAMTQNEIPIPFGLTLEQSKGLKISITLYSPKTGAGKQQIEITGTGQVRLIRTVNYEAPEEYLEGKVSEESARALFNLVESEGFLEFDDDYKTGTVSARKHLVLTLPAREKSVYSDFDSAPPGFDRILGAIKLLAGIGNPMAIGHQYLFSL